MNLREKASPQSSEGRHVIISIIPNNCLGLGARIYKEGKQRHG